MASRKYPLLTDGYYHVFNRGTNGMKLFRRKKDWELFLEIHDYYSKDKPQLRHSRLKNLNDEDETKILEAHQHKQDLIEIIAYCLMPNHFHFVVKQLVDGGISTWLRLASNSYSSNFNRRYQRKGSLYQHPFQSVAILSDEQLIHTVRYVHINPITAGLVSLSELPSYRWSSLPSYLQPQTTASLIKINSVPILSHFTSLSDLTDFTFNLEDYAKNKEDQKYLFLE